jgi:hypothetical protein
MLTFKTVTLIMSLRLTSKKESPKNNKSKIFNQQNANGLNWKTNTIKKDSKQNK